MICLFSTMSDYSTAFTDYPYSYSQYEIVGFRGTLYIHTRTLCCNLVRYLLYEYTS